MIGLDTMLSSEAGRVTIPLTPSVRGRVDSRPVVKVCHVPWVRGVSLCLTICSGRNCPESWR